MFHQEELVPIMGRLNKFALRLTRNASDADDLVQATILRAMEKCDRFEQGTNLFGWTSKMMFNLFASEYRHKKKFTTQYDPAPYIESISVGPQQEACTDLSLTRDHMKRLSKEHRDALLLVCVRGLSYEETAEQLKVPVGTVRSRLSRARKHLLELMEPSPTGIEMSLASARYETAQKMR